MKMHILSKAGLPWLAVLALVACVAAWAVDGRDFAGFYEPKDPTESGDDVILTFKTEVFNYCGEDVLGATVELKSLVDPDEVYASFPAVEIADGNYVRLTQEVTVPSEEYDAWEEGAMPNLTIEFQDAEGNSRLSRVELARTVLGEEE